MPSSCQSHREFVRTAAAGAVSLFGSATPASAAAKLPTRDFGKTGVKVSNLGLGTVALGNLPDRKGAAALLNRAIDLGITYIDTAPASTRIAPITGYGNAQKYLNGVLKERRKEVFLVTKCLETDGDKIPEPLKKNLKQLGVEQVDLTHTHSIGHAVYDFDTLAGDTGPMAVMEKLKKDGLTRFVGVTGHNRPEKFAQILANRDIDAMMNSVDVVDRHTNAFEEVVWPLARKKKVGLAAMKVFGGGIAACKMPEDLRRASLRFALGLKASPSPCWECGQ